MLKLNIIVKTLSTLFIALLFVMVAITLPRSSAAQISWKYFKSQSGAFQLKLPKKAVVESARLRIGPDTLVEAGQVSVIIDERPFKNLAKNYIVKYGQTFGTPLSLEERSVIINSEMELYEEYYKSLDGVLKNKDIKEYQQKAEGEIYITYQDPTLGEQGVRVLTKITDIGKYQQILTGPDNIMYSLESKNYFDSFSVRSSAIGGDGQMKTEWNSFPSPLGLFTFYLPDVDKSYLQKPHTEQSNKKSEMVSFSFYDPVRSQKVFHRIYGYTFNVNLNQAAVKEVIYKRHISKYGAKGNSIAFRSGETADGTPMVEAETSISPPEGFPYLDTIKIRAVFDKDKIMLHEVLGSSRLVSSNFTNNVMGLSEFTPEEYLKNGALNINKPTETVPAQ